jgi:hypothetical protein
LIVETVSVTEPIAPRVWLVYGFYRVHHGSRDTFPPQCSLNIFVRNLDHGTVVERPNPDGIVGRSKRHLMVLLTDAQFSDVP